MSVGSGMYLAAREPLVSVASIPTNEPDWLEPRAHCHRSSETSPSTSVSVAVNATPTTGWRFDSVNVAGSSSFVTFTTMG